jgi:hypothetical protein
VAECVLVYMEPADSAALLAWCRNTTSAAAAFVLYEQICPDSAFGQQMLINLEVRALSSPPPQKSARHPTGWFVCLVRI